jgi:hypothetical protein
MEQATATLGVRIYGVDGRTFSLLSDRPIANTANNILGRLSLPNSTNEVFLDDDPSEDWTLTTAEKDSWAYRERRRSSLWQKIDSYPSINSGEPSPSRSRSRRGSILSLFTHGKDKDGHDVMYSGDGDPEDWGGESSIHGDQPQKNKSPYATPLPARPGSALSPWVRGKDNQGRNVILWIEYE